MIHLSVMKPCRYPIYRIPMGPTLKDFDACFLTYHSLSTPMAGNPNFEIYHFYYLHLCVKKDEKKYYSNSFYPCLGFMMTKAPVETCQTSS